jgi:iron(III) transport system permease protein
LLVLLPLFAGLATCLSPEGLEGLAYWWRDARGWRLVTRSLAFSTFAAAASLLFGAAIALALPRSRSATRAVLLITCLPLLVPSSLLGVGWIMALGRDAVVTHLLRQLLGDATPTVYNWPVAAIATGLRYVGVPSLLLAAALPAIDATRPAERIFRLRLPTRLRLCLSALAAPALAAFLLLVLLIHSDHILPSLFLIPTFGTELLIQYNALMNPASAAALAMVPAGIALAVSVPAAKLLRRSGTWTDSGRGEPETTSTCGFTVRSMIVALLLFLAVGIPIVGIAVRAGSTSNLLLAWREARPEALHSLRLSVVGGLLTVALAIPLARAWVTAHRERAPSAVPLILLNLAVPGSLLALGLTTVFALPGPKAFRDGELPLLLGYAARFTPVATVALLAGWIRLSPLPDVAARVHGVPRGERLLRITLPRYAPAAVASLALVILLIAAELEISLILVPPGPSTLGVRLYTLIHTAPDAVVAGLAVDVMLVVVLAMLAAGVVAHLYGRWLGGRPR